MENQVKQDTSKEVAPQVKTEQKVEEKAQIAPLQPADVEVNTQGESKVVKGQKDQKAPEEVKSTPESVRQNSVRSQLL